jgi:predicted transglutaminase-like cysteine proteinase
LFPGGGADDTDILLPFVRNSFVNRALTSFEDSVSTGSELDWLLPERTIGEDFVALITLELRGIHRKIEKI